MLRIYTWNVNGIRAIYKKGFAEWLKKSNGYIICLQETKAHKEQLSNEIIKIDKYDSYWFPAKRKGYSGVCIYTFQQPIDIKYGFDKEKFDTEGRVISAEFDKFLLVNAYFPNGGRGPERIAYKLDFYNELFFYIEKFYRDRKGIIVTGDFNTAHTEIDLARPKENENTSGFLPEEREWINKIINLGYIDVYRIFNKDGGNYTYWDPVTRARDRNIGWRIDYFMVSDDFVKNIKSSYIHSNIMGSDHCPVSIDIEL